MIVSRETIEAKTQTVMLDVFELSKIVGMDFYSAYLSLRKYGYKIRVIYKNGSDCIVPRDYYPNRINVATQNDVIIEILGLG